MGGESRRRINSGRASIHRLPCAVYRAGTSKCVFFLEEDLPPQGAERDALVLRAFGSPDPRQIDGIGGGDPLTSKAAYIAKGTVPGAELDYTAAYVVPDKPLIDYQGNCGNSAAAVLPFALLRGLVPPREPHTKVTIYNRNTERMLTAEVAVHNGMFDPHGETQIAGVLGYGSRIDLDFQDIAGSHTGKLLPTGNATDRIGQYEVSIVDAFDPVVFVRAVDLGVAGDESAALLEANHSFMLQLHHLRQEAANLIGVAYTPAFPKIAVLAEGGVARTNALERIHKAYPVSGALCLGVAAKIPGTIPQQLFPQESSKVTIAHPCGQMEVETVVTADFKIERAAVVRTARLLLDGIVYVD